MLPGLDHHDDDQREDLAGVRRLWEGDSMSLRERVERFSEERETVETETVSPEHCSHPHPTHFDVNTYVEETGGTVEIEMECTACETLVYEVLEVSDLLSR